MINGKRVIGLIPARSGSKGIPGKNVANCAGRPLIEWTVDAARASKYLDNIVVSTDSLEIAQVALRAGCGGAVSRPAELAADDTPMEAVVVHALKAFPRFDICVLLQPTSPLRTGADIDGALEQLVELKSLTTVASVHESWHVEFRGIDPPPRQQRMPSLMLNGAIYAFDVSWFLRNRRFITPATALYTMPAERSVDIDFPLDLALAGLLIGTSQATTPVDLPPPQTAPTEPSA